MFYKQLNIIFGVSLYICDTLLAQLRNKADLKVKGERIAQLSTLHCALPVPLPVPVPALFKNLSFSKHIDYGQPGRKISVFFLTTSLRQRKENDSLQGKKTLGKEITGRVNACRNKHKKCVNLRKNIQVRQKNVSDISHLWC